MSSPRFRPEVIRSVTDSYQLSNKKESFGVLGVWVGSGNVECWHWGGQLISACTVIQLDIT